MHRSKACIHSCGQMGVILSHTFIPSVILSGLTNEWPCDPNARESDYFHTFYNGATIDLIISERNKYYQYVTNKFTFPEHSRVQKWIDTTPQEFYVFLVLMQLMPLIRKHNIADFWKNYLLIPTPISLFDHLVHGGIYLNLCFHTYVVYSMYFDAIYFICDSKYQCPSNGKNINYTEIAII